MLIKPDYNLESIFNIDLNELKSKGIKYIFSDLDSTIMPSKSAKFPEDVKKWIDELQKDFKFVIITNNYNKNYIDEVKKSCDFDIIFDAKKPKTFEIEKYMKENNISSNQVVMVGDRPLTDIMVGKKLGMTTILVDSITKNTEGILVRFVRKLERITVKK